MVDLLMQILDKVGYANITVLINKNKSLLSFIKSMPGFSILELQLKAFKTFIDINSISYEELLKYLIEQKRDYYNIITNCPGWESWLKNQIWEIKEYLRKL